MRHAACGLGGLGFRARAIATALLITVGMIAAMHGAFEALF